MSNLIDRRAPENTTPFVTGLADAVLREIAELLDTLIETGETGIIDLHSLPMTDADRDMLKEGLGEGEVRVDLDVAGPSRIEETGTAGVWWVRHEGADGRIAAELIEVTRIPEILLSHPDDIREGRTRLREHLDEAGETGTEELAE